MFFNDKWTSKTLCRVSFLLWKRTTNLRKSRRNTLVNNTLAIKPIFSESNILRTMKQVQHLICSYLMKHILIYDYIIVRVYEFSARLCYIFIFYFCFLFLNKLDSFTRKSETAIYTTRHNAYTHSVNKNKNIVCLAMVIELSPIALTAIRRYSYR